MENWSILNSILYKTNQQITSLDEINNCLWLVEQNYTENKSIQQQTLLNAMNIPDKFLNNFRQL